MRIFVTGATGVIGRRVVPLLVQAGHAVIGVARTPEKRHRLLAAGARGVVVDLFDAAAVRRAVQGTEAIINLATAVPPPDLRIMLPWSWRAMDRVRRRVSANLVEAALASGTVRRVIQESFAPIYAEAGERWIDEAGEVGAASYNRSVLDAEAAADRFTRGGGAGVVLRFGMFYGPGDAPTLQIIAGIRRGWFPLPGSAEDYASWIAHEDAATAVVAALGVPAGIYNVVEDAPPTRRELGNGIAWILGAQPPSFLPGWAAALGGPVGRTLARSLRISNRKLRQASGWAPRYRSALEGFEAVIGGRPTEAATAVIGA